MSGHLHRRLYQVGIDVGLRSVGLAAIEVDPDGTPISVLNMETIIHDGGVDPTANKSAGTRKAVSGATRRMRRLIRRRRVRLHELDRVLEALGWPDVPLEAPRGVGRIADTSGGKREALTDDPWFPWRARAELLAGYVHDDTRRLQLLSVAVRHMARHRGWRNPYMTVDALKRVEGPSKEFRSLVDAIASKLQMWTPPADGGQGTPNPLLELSVTEVVQRAQHLDIDSREVVSTKTGEVTTYWDVRRKLRGEPKTGKDGRLREGLLQGKIHQSDNVRELRRILEAQRMAGAPGLTKLGDGTWRPDDDVTLTDTLIDAVFAARTPKGSAKERVGIDPLDRYERRQLELPLDKTERRAEKASLAFQRYRIVSLVANLRLASASEPERALMPDERRKVVELLWNVRVDDKHEAPSWADVAETLGVDRRTLQGTAKQTTDGDRASAAPPFNVTEQRIQACGVKELVGWWNGAPELEREAMLEVLGNGSGSGAAEDAIARVEDVVASLPEDAMGKLDNIKLPAGRAAYSARTLRRLTERMLSSEDDLSAARQAIFGVPPDWKPPADPIGLPVGNPAVDRVLKIVNRYLLAATAAWGTPAVVNIEHAREGFLSESAARDLDRENNARYEANLLMRVEASLAEAHPGWTVGQVRDAALKAVTEKRAAQTERGDGSEVRRYEYVDSVARVRAWKRQNGTCLYCGTALVYGTFDLDHIVPRAGVGATNTQDNLAAVCRACNASKGKLAFAIWASSGVREGVSIAGALERVNQMQFFGQDNIGGRRSRAVRTRQAFRARLQQTAEDDAIDSRSMESVGWMANELRHRVEAWFVEENARRGAADGAPLETRVGVYRGGVTAEARRAAGIEGRILLIGGTPGKTRLDRRHHAVDAAVIAMIRQGAAQAAITKQKVAVMAKEAAERQDWVEAKTIAAAEGMLEWDVTSVLAVRDNLRRARALETRPGTERSGQEPSWQTYKGANPGLWDAWTGQMRVLADLISDELAADRVPVFELLRLKAGSSQAHEDKVRSFGTEPHAGCRSVGAAWSREDIDRSATPQQWLALTRHPDYSDAAGLPEDPTRRIRVKSRWYETTERLPLFPLGLGCVAVRDGYAELGASFHHARIYRCRKHLKSGGVKTFYAMVRVYQLDLLPFRNQASVDLFTVPLGPETISWRTAEPRLREASAHGDADYVGWIVAGDEVALDMSTQTNGQISEVLAAFPGTVAWVVTGFKDTKLCLHPRLLAGEGLPVTASAGVRAIVAGNDGWRPSVDVVFQDCHARVVRRDILGRLRRSGRDGLPRCWQAEP